PPARAGAVVRADGGGAHADRLRPSGREHPGGTAGAELQLVHRCQHPRFGDIADARVTVEHPRYRLMRDAGQPGDIADAGRAGTAPALAAHSFLLHTVSMAYLR